MASSGSPRGIRLGSTIAATIMMLSAQASLIIDDRTSGGTRASLDTDWRVVSDTVMGGVSRGSLVPTLVAGRSCLRLTGEVSLENNGGFVQASLDLDQGGGFDASAYAGIELDVLGNGQQYNLHLRTADTRIVWQSYRASFIAAPTWTTLRLPFSEFVPYRTSAALNLARLRRLGVVAIGREMQADVCIGKIALYR
jgi:hypothetical protein